MSTVAEILEAVKQLSPAQKHELVNRLESVLAEPAGCAAGETQDYFSPEFRARLVAHFHQAKRAALGES